MIKCWNCGKKFKVKEYKALRYVLPACSEECMEYVFKLYTPEVEVHPVNSSPLYFKSEFERLVYEKLKKRFGAVYYEPFILQHGTRQYVPDFYLPQYNIFIEVKGGKITRFSKIADFQKEVILFVLTKSHMELFGWIGGDK